MIPSEFDGFTIERLLGSGGMGTVHLARDTALDRLVAIKVATAIEDSWAQRQFQREARAIARLQHPNVVSIYRIGDASGVPYIAYEFVDGISLAELPVPVRWPRALHLAVQLARGMAAAHRAGVLHRDIKPSNILISKEGVAKIADFGLAKLDTAATGEVPLARAGAMASNLIGTPLYMAPELWRGVPASPQSDVFALGLVFYELLAGAVSSSDAEVIDASHLRTLAPVRTRATTPIPELFADVIDRCLRWEAEARFASAIDLRDALEAVRTAVSPLANDAEPSAGWAHQALVESLGRCLGRGDELAIAFYGRLFAAHPELRPLFPDDLAQQRASFSATLKLLIDHGEDPSAVGRTLALLGQRHAAYGVVPAHFELVGAILLDVLARLDRDHWTDELSASWRAAYARIAHVMMDAMAQPSRPIATVPLGRPLDLPVDRPPVRFAMSEGNAIAYQVFGHGPQDLVMLAGWPANLDVGWRCPPLAESRRRLASVFRMIVVNARGVGLSDRAISLSADDHAADCLAVLNHAGAERVVVLASGEACAHACLIAASYPERLRALVLCGPRLTPHPPDESTLAMLRSGWGGSMLLERYAPSFLSDPELRSWWNEFVRGSGSPAACAAYLTAAALTDVSSVLPGIATPTLIVQRRGDRMVDLDEVRTAAAVIPSARLLEVAGDDHLMFAGNNVEILEEIVRFVGVLPAEPIGALSRLVTAVTVLGAGPVARNAFRLVRRAGGQVVTRTWDERLCATFASVHTALGCALDIARTAELKAGSVRIGVAANVIVERDRDPPAGVGPLDESLALARCGSHGQVVVSDLVAGILGGSDIKFSGGDGGIRVAILD